MSKKKWESLHDYEKKRSVEIARKYLESKDTEERRTGAIVAGQLKLREAIPRLRVLLKDDAHKDLFSLPFFWKKEYFVADAAQESLEKMGEKAGEEPSQRKK